MILIIKFSLRGDSNSQSSVYKTDALSNLATQALK